MWLAFIDVLNICFFAYADAGSAIGHGVNLLYRCKVNAEKK
jgi:hypothetical protein